MKKHLGWLVAFGMVLTAAYQVNVVISNHVGERVERAIITNSGSCAIGSQSGSWVSSVSHSGTGVCALTFVASTFSTAPHCVCTVSDSSANANKFCSINTLATTSGVSTQTNIISTNATAFDLTLTIICMGPR